jgi:hypothetical protein
VASFPAAPAPGREEGISSNISARRRRIAVSVVLGILIAATVAASASATHPRPGTGTPFRVPLAPAFRACATPDTSHAAPFSVSGCSGSPRITSEILTMSPRGVSSGFFKLAVFCSDGVTPPCNPSNGTDTEDVQLKFSQTDVLCAVGGVTGCTAAGADYTAPLVAQVANRITDHANGGAACTNTTGAPPCVVATVQDKVFSYQVSCVATSGAIGSTCSSTTSMDTLVPGFVKEQQLSTISVLSVSASDMGPDGAVGGGCPPTCGTGDETRYLDQAVFAP